MGTACQLGAQPLHTCLGAFWGSHRRAQDGLSGEGCTWKGRQRVSEAAQRCQGSATASGKRLGQSCRRGQDSTRIGAELCGPHSPAATTSLDENSTQASWEFSEPQMNLVRENSTEHKGKGSEPPAPDTAPVGLGNWACSRSRAARENSRRFCISAAENKTECFKTQTPPGI